MENFTRIPNEIINNKQLKPVDFKILVFMYSKPSNWIFSIRKLSIQLSLSTPTIQKSLKHLFMLGYLEKKINLQYCVKKLYTGQKSYTPKCVKKLHESVQKFYTHSKTKVRLRKESNKVVSKNNLVKAKENKQVTLVFLKEKMKALDISSFTAEKFYYHYQSKNYKLSSRHLDNLLLKWHHQELEYATKRKKTISQVTHQNIDIRSLVK